MGQVSEDVVLANLLADLSLLDYHVLRFYPSTLAASIVFLTRIMMQHMSEYRLSVTSMGLLTTQSREVLGLCKYRRPFVERSTAYDEVQAREITLSTPLRACPMVTRGRPTALFCVCRSRGASLPSVRW